MTRIIVVDNKHSKKPTTSMWRRAFELKSLEDVWQTLIVTLIQLVCMWRAFDRIGKYSGSAAWLPFQRPLAQLALYVVCLTASVCLLPIMVWSGLCRIGVYANDRFKFGVDLDTERIVKSEFKKRANVSPAATSSSRQRRHSSTHQEDQHHNQQRPKSMTFLTNSNKAPINNNAGNGGLKRFNSSSCAGIDSFMVVESSLSSAESSSSPPLPPPLHKFDYFSDTASSSGVSSGGGINHRHQHRLIRNNRRRYHYLNDDVLKEQPQDIPKSSLLQFNSIWRNFMPVSSLLHLIIALCLLFPNTLLVSKQIQYGLRPKGNIHHTELDFVFSRPLQRFSETNGQLNGGNLEEGDSKEPLIDKLSVIKFKLITALLEDNDEIKYEPQISLELVNFVLAAVSFAVHYASPLWHVNKPFALLFSAHIALFAALNVVSFAAFEVLVKFEGVFANGIRFTNFNGSMNVGNGGDKQLLNSAILDLPFLTTPLTLSIVFVISFVLLLISSVPIYSFALSKYKLRYERLRNGFLNVIEESNRATNCRQRFVVEPIYMSNCDEINSSNSKRKSKLLSNDSSPKSEESANPNNNTTTNANNNATNNTTSNKFDYLSASVSKNVGNVTLLPSILPNIYSSRSKLQQQQQTTAAPPRSSFVSSSSTSESDDLVTASKSTSANTSGSSLVDYSPYKSHLAALLILILICLNSVFVFYDCLCLHRLTSDCIPLWSALAHSLFIIWYIILWSVLTIKSNMRVEFAQIFKLNMWYFLNKLIPTIGLPPLPPSSLSSRTLNRITSTSALKPPPHHQSAIDLYSKIDRQKSEALAAAASAAVAARSVENSNSVYEIKVSPRPNSHHHAYESGGEDCHLMGSSNPAAANYDNSVDYIIANKRLVYAAENNANQMFERNYDNPHEDVFPIYENYKNEPHQAKSCSSKPPTSFNASSKPPPIPSSSSSQASNLKRLAQSMSSDQRLAPLLEATSTASSTTSPPVPSTPTRMSLISETKTLSSVLQKSNKPQINKSTKMLYESLTQLNDKPSDSAAVRSWKNRSSERLLQTHYLVPSSGHENEKLLVEPSSSSSPSQNEYDEYSSGVRPLRQAAGFVQDLERAKQRYASNGSIKSHCKPSELYASVNQIDVNTSGYNKNPISCNNNNETMSTTPDKRHQIYPNTQKSTPKSGLIQDQLEASGSLNSRLLLKDYLSKTRTDASTTNKPSIINHQSTSSGSSNATTPTGTTTSPSSTTNSPVNTSNTGSSSSSSSSSSTDDSGRHSMTDSPLSSNPSSTAADPSSSPTTMNSGDIYSVKLVKTTAANPSIPPTAAGTFTSKCTLSSGNSITLSQTLQNVLLKQPHLIGPHPIMKRSAMSRSSSRDSGLIFVKNSSTPSPAASTILTAAPNTASNAAKNTSTTSINLNKF